MVKKVKRRVKQVKKPARDAPVRRHVDFRQTADDTFDSFSLPLDPDPKLLTDGTRTCLVYPELFPDTVMALEAEGFHELRRRDALSFLLNSPLLRQPDLSDEELYAQLSNPDIPGILGEFIRPALVDRRRSALHTVGFGLGAHYIKAPSAEPHLLTTTTGETVKPVRLLYAVRDLNLTILHLTRLPWVGVDPDKKRLVWINDNLPPHVTISAYPPSTILASLFFGPDWMWVQTNASARALAFIELFADPLKDRASLLYGLDTNRYFTGADWATAEVDRLFLHARVLTPSYLVNANPVIMDIPAVARMRHEQGQRR